jgi:Fur family iron response transcriptional regulator
MPVSLATVYNTMHQFTESGFARSHGRRQPDLFRYQYGNHHHFYCEDDGTLLDIDGDALRWPGAVPPPGAKLTRRRDRAPEARQ